MDDNRFEVFDGEQKKVLMDMQAEILKAREARETDMFGLDVSEQERQDRSHLAKVRDIWKRGGRLPGASDRLSIDALLEKDTEVTRKMRDNFSTDHPMLTPRTLSNIVREAIEPALVLTPLLQRVSYSHGPRITFPTYGALANGAADIAEGQEYPAGSMEMGGQSECIIGKSGIALQVTEEQKRYSQYDIISMNLRACGRALARHKERKVADLITTNGITLIDNTSSSYPSATGRDAGGSYNGTLTLDDIFKAWSTMINTGFVPNTLIMHPFAWRIFAEDGMSRLFGFNTGNQSMLYQMPLGQPGNAGSQWAQSMLNKNTYVTAPGEIATTFTRVPSLFPTSFNIIVSPYMPFTASNNTTDIVFCDVNELGILVVDEEVSMDEWNDPSKDIMRMKLRERYGLAVLNDGMGIGLLKNIKIGKSVDFADRLTLQMGTGDLGNSITGDESYVANPL